MNFDEKIHILIDAYLDETLSGSELRSFETRLKSDATLAQEVEIQREMRERFGNSNEAYIAGKYHKEELSALKNYLASDEVKELSKKIEEGKRIYELGTKKKRFTPYLYYAAATIALIIFVKMFFFTNNLSPQDLYTKYKDWENLPSITAKGDEPDDLAKGEAFFREGKYDQAIVLFENNVHVENPQILIYLGVSYLESDDIQKALMIFNQLLNNNTLDSDKAYWYLSLAYLKQGSIEKAVDYLHQIRSDSGNYNFEAAGKLLKELDSNSP